MHLLKSPPAFEVLEESNERIVIRTRYQLGLENGWPALAFFGLVCLSFFVEEEIKEYLHLACLALIVGAVAEFFSTHGQLTLNRLNNQLTCESTRLGIKSQKHFPLPSSDQVVAEIKAAPLNSWKPMIRGVANLRCLDTLDSMHAGKESEGDHCRIVLNYPDRTKIVIFRKFCGYEETARLIGLIKRWLKEESPANRRSKVANIFDEHSRVRIGKLVEPKTKFKWGGNPRAPRIGDMGIVVDIHGDRKAPTAYTVEGFEDEKEIWLTDFLPEELEAVTEE